MAPTIALYATPPSSVCSTPYPCSINTSSDYDLNPRASSSPSCSSNQKPIIGGLSSLFASSSVRHTSSSSFTGVIEELGSHWHDRGEELSSSYGYSPYSSFSSSLKCRDQSPVSVFQGPVSCGSVGSSRSSPSRISRGGRNGGDLHLSNSLLTSRDGLFSGFIRNALGSCIDTGSSIRDEAGGDYSAALVDELTFNMEDNFMDMSCEPDAKELLIGAQLRHKVFQEELVVKAFYEAEKAHRGQMRLSGDPYLLHCVQTAILLADIGANSTVVAAGLLHDTLDDSHTSYDYILQAFGAEVADLVRGVSKLSHLSKLARENNTASQIVEADRLHTMFLAMADPMVVLIKLADRLHNMMTLNALPMLKQQRFAKETLEIFVPLANRLGISDWKEQLENLCFKHLNPEQHKELSSKLVKSFDEALITLSIEKMEQALKDGGVSYHVLYGRHKSLYSIYDKMKKKKLSLDEIHDIHGLRLIVEKEEDCYTALRIVHQLWPEVPGKLKDYITHPKINGYQSLHTVVSGENMSPLEVQIRSKDMHLQAEFGFAAHWRYKEGDCKHSSFVVQRVEWAQWAVSWKFEAKGKDRLSSLGNTDSIRPLCPFPWHLDGCPYSYIPHSCEDDPVFVAMIENEKMSILEFPTNATVMDLLERVGRGSSKLSPYRFPVKEELRPTLNHEPVSDPTIRLKTGDVVHLTPAIPDESLTQYREEIQRMYDRGLRVSSSVAPSIAGKRS
ncbi:hypothetical protein AQUCO_02000475v1 [Aquilegia coerulea]|uniref:GTP diphosphokinase n=1 Tax=Aquilegia coerulea TaxID=218851 RepID=A0A2G5DIJ0_AQUCA|nr:hypothetical protein AQUCO_02000475v1 [Aquilegia coerulea]